ncbi:hypothetical protein KKC32_00235 [Patescibacteria group bacterium]|nr:hypothetical protein [Patescibacteria group bacterium]
MLQKSTVNGIYADGDITDDFLEKFKATPLILARMLVDCPPGPVYDLIKEKIYAIEK